MATEITRDQLEGLEVFTADGYRLGKVEEIYFVESTDASEWVAVRAGFLGMKRMLVPLEGGQVAGTELRLAYTRRQLEAIPLRDESRFESDDDERSMYRSFGLEYPGRSFGYEGSDYLAGGVAVNDMPEEQPPVRDGSQVVKRRKVAGGSVRLHRWLSPDGARARAQVSLRGALDIDHLAAEQHAEEINDTELIDREVDEMRDRGSLRINNGLRGPRKRDR